MSTSVASDLDTKRASRGGGAGKIAIFAAKLLVTGACFWYLSRQINLVRSYPPFRCWIFAGPHSPCWW